MAALFPSLVKFKLNERLYPAQLAGLNYEFFAADKGIVIRIYGFNQHIPLMVETLASEMINFTQNLTEDQFRMFVERNLRMYYNVLIKPNTLKR